MKKILFLCCVLSCFFVQAKQPNSGELRSNFKKSVQILRNPSKKYVLVSAHRGDWRNAPENSIQALKKCIKMGVDIVEIDLKKTKDGQLVIMHDNTIDRTTTGAGKPEDYTLAELKAFRLKNATGHPTAHTIPTLDEFAYEANDKVLLCIDKGFKYFDQAMGIINKYNMADQIIYNLPAITLDSLNTLGLMELNSQLMLNVIIGNSNYESAKKIVTSYCARKNAIIHPTFSSDTTALVRWLPSIPKMGLGLWINALWPEHNGGHDDDKAVEENKPDESWGWIYGKGATIIQTDRPNELLNYLRRKNLHP